MAVMPGGRGILRRESNVKTKDSRRECKLQERIRKKWLEGISGLTIPFSPLTPQYKTVSGLQKFVIVSMFEWMDNC